MKNQSIFAFPVIAFLVAGCISVKTDSTVRLEPVYMTLDVNLKVQLQKELTNVFGDIDAASKTVE